MSLRSTIDSVLHQATESDGIPGIVGMAADRGGVIYEGAFGKLALNGDAVMRTDSVFRIASMTKPITATAIMQLIEQGRIGLDQPAGEIVEGLRHPQVLEGFDAEGKAKLRPARRPILIRHLLTHTSGFSYDIFNADVGRYMRQAGLPSITTCRRDSLKAPLIFDPGDRWEYGIGVDWLGQIVQQVSSQPLDAYVDEHIARPLGMVDTTFKPMPAQRPRMASVHITTAGGDLVPVPMEFPTDTDFVMGGGGAYSTAPDYLRFTRMILNGGTLDNARLLKPETVAMMGENQIGALEVPTLFKSDNPMLALTLELLPGITKKWGLSFMLNAQPLPTGRGAWSMAWSGLFNTFFWIDPARALTAVLMMQHLPAGASNAMQTLLRYEYGLYRALRA